MKSCNKCYEFYQQQKQTLFLADLLLYPGVNRDIIELLLLKFKDSTSMKAMIYQDLFDLLAQRKLDVFCDAINRMEDANLLHRDTAQKVSKINLDESLNPANYGLLASAFVSEVSISGEPLMAASFAAQFLEMGVSLDMTTIDSLILNVSRVSTLDPALTTFTIKKLLIVYGHEKLSPKVLLNALICMLSEPHVPFYANNLYDTIKGPLKHEKDLPSVMVKLIGANINKGHLLRAADIWNDLLNISQETALKEIDLLDKLLKRLMEEDLNRASIFLESVPFEMKTDKRLIEITLSVLGRAEGKEKEFTSLSKQLAAPLSRKALSSLFVSFLYHNNEAASDKLLQAIFKTSSGLSALDFEALIVKLLKHDKFEKSISMCAANNITVSKLGLIRVLEYVLQYGDLEQRADFLKLFCRQMRKLKKSDPALHVFTKAVMRYLSSKVSNSISRTLYLSKAYTDSSKKDAEFNFKRQGLPELFNDLISIDDYNRISCLNVIYRQAIKEEDQVNISWCLKELRSLGVSVSDIFAHYLIPEKA